MKRAEMSQKIEVECPTCPAEENKRLLSKSSYKGDLTSPPYVQRCRDCTNRDRTMSPEARAKISQSLKGTKQSEAVVTQRSEHWKSHPELWVNLRPELGPESRKGTHHSAASKKKISEARKGTVVSPETKQKISEGVKRAKGGGK